LLEDFHIPLVCFSVNSSLETEGEYGRPAEWCWQWEKKVLGEGLSLCHFIHHTPYTQCPGLKLGTSRR